MSRLTIISGRTVYRGKAGPGTVRGWIHEGGCENDACLAAIAAGRPWHAIPAGFAATLDTYHYRTRNEAFTALERKA